MHLFGGDHSVLVMSSYQATINRDNPKGWHSCMEWEKPLKRSPRMLIHKLDPAPAGGISTNSFWYTFPSFFVFLKLIFQLFSFFLPSLFSPSHKPLLFHLHLPPPFYVNTILSSWSSSYFFPSWSVMAHHILQLFSYFHSFFSTLFQSFPLLSASHSSSVSGSKAVPLLGSREEVCSRWHQELEPWT